MPIESAELTDRAVLSVSGPGAAGFLQGLVTCNVEALQPGAAAFGALLTPQGKILFDFFVVATADGFLIEAPVSLAPDLAKRLKFYRLRAKVDIADRPDLRVLALYGGIPEGLPGTAYADPRLAALGARAIVPAEAVADWLAADGVTAVTAEAFRVRRIALGVPEGGLDFAYGDAFPHDANMDDLGGVDFAKGCYVGQEVVSRMKHRGTARRRIVQVEGDRALPPAGTEIVAGGKPAGTLGAHAGTAGLALLRIDRVREAIDAGQPVTAGDTSLSVALPGYARFVWPAAATD
ncbi:CAF17-like 4Fe-4S cluster assembly/insertion protein YgfZ [Prosthecodimorpha staleyi]|uniref:Folate-binding protein n=1 Tax=Prosthecodimorpha staleyi TaxID=2840188 RepID=A0A947D1P3_9HYPH|nr:folate-binding protein [Prosthecodimorpha staleyi]MBT9288653.1 folate-binding protein [Prosthecodimorpha staleyi]